jgi:hypothetical protein
MLETTYYIEFLSATAGTLSPAERYQPFFIGETRSVGGLSYQFAPFGISGDVSTDGSESGDYELVAPANMISSAKLWQASEDRYFIRILSILLGCTPPANENSIPIWNELGILSSTICVCDSFGYADAVPADLAISEDDDFSPVTLRLTNPLNFVAGTAPTRRLTAGQVGPLPSSGGIAF